MMSRSLRGLTGENTDKAAWEALFRYSNRTRNLPSRGYQRGEKIAIKINANQDRSAEWGTGPRPVTGLPSPHAVRALVNQLITVGSGLRTQCPSLFRSAHNMHTLAAEIHVLHFVKLMKTRLRKSLT